VATINVDGQKIRVIPRDYALHPVSDQPIHVDFLRVTVGASLHVKVPVQFVNEDKAPGLKAGGVLNIVSHELDVTAPADAIPDHIVVDLTGLEIGSSVHLSNVSLPEGVKPTAADDVTLATIVAPAALTSEEAAEAAAAEAPKA